jgi:long-subunit fatty acid transport protein
MSFSRRGTYDAVDLYDPPYEGQGYATVENDPKPPLGFAGFQPLPVVAVSWDLGGRVPNLTIGGGLYTPSGYPFRDMTNGYQFQTDPAANYDGAPPPTRYDIMTQESALLFPSVAAAYRITPDLDIGVRLTAGNFKSKTQVVVWATPNNWEEDVKKDAMLTADVSDGFIPAAGIGVSYRIGPNIELGANWTSPIVIKSHGTATSLKGPGNDPSLELGAVPDANARCAKGGTMEESKACISLQLPMTATVGGRYKILDETGGEKAGIELDLTWENWGKTCDFSSAGIVGSSCTSPGQYRVQIDTGVYTNGQFQRPIEVNAVNLGLRDTFGARLGGSYRHPVGDAKLVGRAGVAYDIAAAKEGWLRANFDGASRVMGALGVSYETSSWQVNAGFGYIHEGTNTNPGASADGSDCNITPQTGGGGCGAGGALRDPADRQGPDPTNPLVGPDVQAENPYNQGSITSHYMTFLLGFSKSW